MPPKQAHDSLPSHDSVVGNNGALPRYPHTLSHDSNNIPTGTYADIKALLNGTLPEPPKPTILTRDDGRAILYEGEINVIYGESGGGKTFCALVAAVETIKSKRGAGFVDLDGNGVHSIASRLMSLGATAEEISNPALFRYWEPEDADGIRQIIAEITMYPIAFIVLDCIGQLLPYYGANSNSPDDYTRVVRAVMKPIVKTGACLVNIDHEAKNLESGARGATGTIAKKRDVGGAMIQLKSIDMFRKGHGGRAELILHKDRHGGLNEHCQPIAARSNGPATAKIGEFVLKPVGDGTDNMHSYVYAATGSAPIESDRPSQELRDSWLALSEPRPKTVTAIREALKVQQGSAVVVARWAKEQHDEPTTSHDQGCVGNAVTPQEKTALPPPVEPEPRGEGDKKPKPRKPTKAELEAAELAANNTPLPLEGIPA